MKELETDIIRELRQGKESAYQYIYAHYYSIMCHVAFTYLKDKTQAECAVSDVMVHLWEVKERIDIKTALKNYLIQSVRNHCLNLIKSEKGKYVLSMTDIDDSMLLNVDETEKQASPLGELLNKELEQELSSAIDRLPNPCKQVFLLSRFEGKTYPQIAEDLDISVPTVKYHMKNALTLLYEMLKNYLVISIPFLIFRVFFAF